MATELSTGIQRTLRFAAMAALAALFLSAVGPPARAQTFSVLHAYGSSATDGTFPTAAPIQAKDGYFYGMTSSGGLYGKGVVYRVDSAGNVTLLHSFGATATDAQIPQTSLIQAADGNFYGATSGGGANGGGTAFKMDSAGNFTILNAFGSTGTGPSQPTSLIQGSDGNFYGTSSAGGTNNEGALFRMDSAGNVTLLYSFNTGNPLVSAAPNPLIQAADGYFYGTTQAGGTYGGGLALKMDLTGKVTLLHSFGANSSDAIAPRTALFQATDGNLYGTTYYGGANGAGVTFKMDSAGNVTLLHSFGSGPTDGQNPDAALIQTADGSFYGTAASGGVYNNGAVFRMDSAGNVSIVRSFQAIGTGPNPLQGGPIGLVLAADSSFYGATDFTFFRLKRGRGFDANADGFSDVLWRNTVTGDVVLWEMNGLNISAQNYLYHGIPLSWQVAGVGDFNGDGKTDILWRNTTTGDVSIWLMNGFNIAGSGTVAAGVPLSWQIAGVGDFNGDGKDDILWRNTVTGDVVLWEMNGLNISVQNYLYHGIPLSWQVAGVGDFDGDGKADIVWRNSSTGDVIVWLMNGFTLTHSNTVARAVPLSWQIEGVGDFTGGGSDGILWRDSVSGAVVTWLMDGVEIREMDFVAGGVPSQWQIAGIGDFNGDFSADILWRNTVTGDVYLWEMNGFDILNQGYVGYGIPLPWRIAAPQ